MRFLNLFYIFLTLSHAEPFYVDEPLEYIDKKSCGVLLQKKDPNSHIHVYIPTIPYTYVSRLINGTLLRVSDNEKGWEYMMATKVEQINALTYDVSLREGVKFQDGTPFSAKNVVKNFTHFIKNPFTYTDIHNRLKGVEEINRHIVRFHLSAPYGMFLHDLASINLYSNVYLEKFGWMGEATGDSMIESGLYGLGPFILYEGYATGRKQTEKVILKANPNYYEKNKPYIQTITIYTKLGFDEAVSRALSPNSSMDITPIPFNKKIEAVLSQEAKLVVAPSMHNYTLYFNMLKPGGVFKEESMRQAIVKAIDQNNLLNFVYKKEGKLSPSAASSNYTAISSILPTLKNNTQVLSKAEKNELHKTLNGLKLDILTQDRFMFLWRGIEYQLQEYGVTLNFHITQSEKTIYENLLTNHLSPKEWDILTWGNDDWYGNHPWTVFFTYREGSEWSMLKDDFHMKDLLLKFFEATPNTDYYNSLVKQIISHANKKSYLLPVPSPNLVLAVNKEVDYKPSASAIMPLWNTKISNLHRSVRNKPYPDDCKKAFFPQRMER